jgi:DMSO/TMAO reductase YedYZ molybdopterin-dependent catalytic subunit
VLADSLDGLRRDDAVVAYCASGYRSTIAASVLAEAGFSDVSDVIGGYTAWVGAGLPVTTGSIEAGRTPHVSPRSAKARVDGGAVLLDVREPEEWEVQHAPDAVLIPMGHVRARLDELPRDRQIVVVCRSGGRSAAITDALCAWGFDAVNLAGGMCAWASAGLPVHAVEDHDLVVHREDPLNCETSLPALIGGVVMPNARFYVRSHFPVPSIDATTWRLDVRGLVEQPLSLSLRDLQNMRSQTVVATLECAGNGRSFFDPPAPGEQWRLGAVSTAEWTGVPLADVLDRAVPSSAATTVVLRGTDTGIVERSPEAVPFERGLSLDDARGSEALLAYAMNGEPLPLQHGYPLRVIVPGWYAVTSVKWLAEIELTDRPFDGFFQVDRYVFEWESAEGTTIEPVRLQRVRSLITEPAEGADVPLGDAVIRGVAWSGAAPIGTVDVSIDGREWQAATLVGERRRHRWQWWELITRFTEPGPVTIRSRATDLAGRTQPELAEWNRLGYGGNAIQSVAVSIG